MIRTGLAIGAAMLCAAAVAQEAQAEAAPSGPEEVSPQLTAEQAAAIREAANTLADTAGLARTFTKMCINDYKFFGEPREKCQTAEGLSAQVGDALPALDDAVAAAHPDSVPDPATAQALHEAKTAVEEYFRAKRELQALRRAMLGQ